MNSSSQSILKLTQAEARERAERAVALTAEAAASAAKPKVYRLTSSEAAANQKPLHFFALGCQGSGASAQKEVAELMNEIAAHPDKKPDFILLLGDNVYDFGADSPTDTAFQANFHQVYRQSKLKHIANIPCFVILGNHDENLHTHNHFIPEKGISRGMHQVAHTYMPDKRFSTVEDKKLLFAHDDVQLDLLSGWNMPSRFYALDCGATQIFCIDSNTYAKDYLDYLLSEKTPNTNNQAYWLETELKKAKASGKRTLLALHHPPYTPGKRAYKPDCKIYLTKAYLDFAERQHEGFNASIDPYNELIARTLATQQLTFDTILTAHDHAIYYYNDQHTRQFTLGGGGGKLQKRLSFTEQAQMGCYLKDHGFADIQCDSQNPAAAIQVTLYTTHGLPLVFTNTNTLPCQQYPASISENEKQDIALFVSVVHTALNHYFEFLGDMQDDTQGNFFGRNLSHGHDGAERAHTVWQYINQYYLGNFATLVGEIARLTNNRITKPSPHSLITLLNAEISKRYKDVNITNINELLAHTSAPTSSARITSSSTGDFIRI